ncbi:MAG: hypothetical protein ACYCPN_00370 [Thermoplasmata archaeon]
MDAGAPRAVSDLRGAWIIARYRLRFYRKTFRLQAAFLFALVLTAVGSLQPVPHGLNGVIPVVEGFLASGLNEIGFLMAVVPACVLAGSGIEWNRGRSGLFARSDPHPGSVRLGGMWIAAALGSLMVVFLYAVLIALIAWARFGSFPILPWTEAIGVVALITLAAVSVAAALSLLFREVLWGVVSSLVILLGLLQIHANLVTALHQAVPSIPESLAWNLQSVAPVMVYPLSQAPVFPLLGGSSPPLWAGVLIIVYWWVGAFLVGGFLTLQED